MLSQDKSSIESGFFYLQKVDVEQQAIRKALEGLFAPENSRLLHPKPQKVQLL